MMGVAGIKMERIGNVVVACNGICCGNIDILAPAGASDDDEVRWVVFADFFNNRQGVGFDGRPGLLLGLIPYFVDDIRRTSIKTCHICKEGLGLYNVFVCMMIMPVNDYINTSFYSTGGQLLPHCSLLVRLLQVSSIRLNGHGQPDKGNVEIIYQPVDDIVVVVFFSAPYTP